MIHMSQFRETHIKTNKEPYNPKHIKNLIFNGVEYNEKINHLVIICIKKGLLATSLHDDYNSEQSI